MKIPKKAKEILALLANNGPLHFRRSSAGYFRVVSENKAPWVRFHRRTLLYAINLLNQNGLLDINDNSESGLTKIALSEEGRGLANDLSSGSTRPKEWDRKWRLVFFDIPEDKKKCRDALRYHLHKMGLAEFQRSAFISPFPCFREIKKLAEQFHVEENIVLVTADTLSNEFQFKEYFKLV